MDLGFFYYIRKSLSPDFKKIKERIMNHFFHILGETMSIPTLLKDNGFIMNEFYRICIRSFANLTI
jgi:hypothetical protein